MTQPSHRLTDRRALGAHRERAIRSGMADFLHADCIAEAHERLAEVNRRFTSPAIVTGFPDLWRSLLPGARIVADDEVLDLEHGAHDLVVHALALHWAEDPVGQLVQCRLALAPDGLFLGCLFGGRSLQELRACLAEAEVAECGGLSPRVLPMADVRAVGDLLQRAGFALPVADSTSRRVIYRDAYALMRDLRAMGETNALAERSRKPGRRGLFSRMGECYAATAAAQGGVSATVETIWLAGWAPAEGQPQPLRPGSAVRRLADALGTKEEALPRTRGGGTD